MSPDRTSKLKLYSLGIVTEDKARKSDTIKVCPIEDIHMDQGLIKDQVRKYESNMPNHQGVKKTGQLKGGSILDADWIPYGHSNRISAPDVIKNETVLLFRFADTGKYYWTTVFREPKIRRLETVLYAFGNLVKGLIPWTKESSYWCEVSTHDKYIKIHTSKSDGEPYEYDLHLNTETGFLHINDDIGNYIDFNSSTNTLHCHMNKEICLDTPVIRFRTNVITREGYSGYKGNSETTATEVGYSS
jgi:hypothetical protein